MSRSLKVAALLCCALGTAQASTATRAPLSEASPQSLWRTMLEASAKPDTLGRFDSINRSVNRLRFIPDTTSNHWSTPYETLARGGGDCEDLAITKYFALRALGIPANRLRIAHVRSSARQVDHMVLVYRTDGSRQNDIILDNLTDYMAARKSRPDLQFLFTFNEESVWVVDRKGRSISRPASLLKRWVQLQNRLKEQA